VGLEKAESSKLKAESSKRKAQSGKLKAESLVYQEGETQNYELFTFLFLF
jgi:hypothetical protein